MNKSCVARQRLSSPITLTYCDIFLPAERVPIYGLPINRYIYKGAESYAGQNVTMNKTSAIQNVKTGKMLPLHWRQSLRQSMS